MTEIARINAERNASITNLLDEGLGSRYFGDDGLDDGLDQAFEALQTLGYNFLCGRLFSAAPEERYGEFTSLARAFQCNLTLYEEWRPEFTYMRESYTSVEDFCVKGVRMLLRPMLSLSHLL